jgi:hypothetical protein
MQTTPCAQIKDESEEEFGTSDLADLPKVNGAMREGRTWENSGSDLQGGPTRMAEH